MVNWWIGCSGFQYKHWKEIFYPKEIPQRKWFEFYCDHFNTVELNVTFYRFPKLPFLQSWFDRSPDKFKFSVKAPRWITDFNQFRNSSQMIQDFYGLVQEGLQEKLGCVLFQLPPSMVYSDEKLYRILESLDPSFPNVLEFRHESWWTPHVFDALSKNKVTFSGMSHPNLPESIVRTAPTLYYRFHGVPELYKSRYSSAEIHSFADLVANSTVTTTAFIYFNNDIDGGAITNATQLMRLTQTVNSPRESLKSGKMINITSQSVLI